MNTVPDPGTLVFVSHDLEAERDSAALHGATWGLLFHKTWPVVQRHIDEAMMEHPDDVSWKDTSLAGLRQVVLPEGIIVIDMLMPAGLYDVDGKRTPVVVKNQKLCNVADGHEEAITAAVQKILDELPKPSAVAIYAPPTPWLDKGTVGWFWRVAVVDGATNIKHHDSSEP